MKKITFLTLLILIITSSCSIQKRVYNSGYHVTWNHSQKAVDQETISENKTASSEKITSQTLATKNEVENKLISPSEFSVKNIKSTNANQVTQSLETENVKTPLISDLKQTNNKISERKNENSISNLKTFSSFKKSTKAPIDDITILLYILCFLIPPIAVGIVTGWEVLPLVISIILTCLFWFPGIIYAIYQVYKNS